MKKKVFIAIIVAVALGMSACGQSGTDEEMERIREENESLKAQLSNSQTLSETTSQVTESSIEETASDPARTETESTNTTKTEESITNAEVVENEYRPDMYLKYVRPCAEGIGTMSQSEVETLLTDIEEIEKSENDSYYFYEFSDTEYTYTTRISKNTGKVSLVAMSLSDFSFNVYIESEGSQITYLLDGEYGTEITKDFDKYADSLEESERFIFSGKSEYVNVNSDNLETISLDEYNRLEIGMSYSDAIFIIGGYGERISESEIDGFYTHMYQFEGEGSIGANAILIFQNGELYSKAQSGLQ